MKFKWKRKYTGFVAAAAVIVLALYGLNKWWNEISRDWYVDEHLGNNYLLICDGNSILYRLDDREYFVIPSNVRSIAYDEKWIIAKTKGLKASYKGIDQQCEDGSQYWIIDKDAPVLDLDSMYKSDSAQMLTGDSISRSEAPIISTGVIGPMDSVTFDKKMHDLGIKLALKRLHYLTYD